MSRRLLSTLLVLMIIICGLPVTASADIEPPVTLTAPEHFGVGHYVNDSVYFTLSLPQDIRSYVEKRAADDPENMQSLLLHFQVDYKIDNGSWHHTSAWDSHKTVPDGLDDMYLTFINDKLYNKSERWSMTSIFQENDDLKPFYEGGWDYLKSHSITFRVRFAESFDYGETTVLSPWSKEYTLSANTKADYKKLINHAPTLLSAEVKLSPSGEPYFQVRLDKVPGEVQDLNSMSSGTVRTEIWMRRAGDKDYKQIHYEWANWEYLEIQASDYFEGTTQSFEAAGYEIKTRYALDLREYKQSGIDSTTDVNIYGPFSNVISHNMPAWSEASKWATAELKKADEYGLIPQILQGADMTKPITREEFAELAIKLYEKTTGKAAEPTTPNPFTDTTNPQVLKAFKVGVTTGTSATTFAPKELTNREQVATMLSRAIRVMAPGGDFSTTGAPAFSDQKDISSWASEHVKFMSKNEIIKGTNGKFMPKATTTAEKASGYATTTREMAIAMSVRSYDKFKAAGTSAAAPSSPSPAATPAAPEAAKPASLPGVPTAEAAESKELADWIIGTWGYGTSNGPLTRAVHFNAMYEFKADGTFYKILSSMYLGANSATAYEGKYRISDGKLILSSQLKSTGPATSHFDKIWYYTMDSYDTKDVPAEDVEYQISRNDDGTLKIGDTDYTRGR